MVLLKNERKKEMKKFEVEISRTAFMTFEVEVNDNEDFHIAEEKAMQMAYNENWASADAEYNIDAVNERN